MPRAPSVRHLACGVALAGFALTLACSDLQPITAGVCGNGAVEPGEDCDGASAIGTCGDGSDANACHFVCTAGAACPAGDGCGLDGRCRAPSGTFVAAPGPYAFQATSFRVGDVDGDGYADLVGIDSSRLQVRAGNAAGDLHDSTAQLIPKPESGVAIGDLDGDGRTDVMFTTASGLVTYLGSPEGIAPHPNASIDLHELVGGMRIHQAHPPGSSGLDLVVATDAAVGSNGALENALVVISNGGIATALCMDGTPLAAMSDCVDAFAGSGSGLGSAAPGAVEKLLGGDLAVGHTCSGAACKAPPGAEVALALVNEPRAAVLAATAGGTGLRLVQYVTIPSGSDGTVAFADFTGDGCDDLGVGTGNALTIAVGDCTGVLGNPGSAAFTDGTGKTIKPGTPRAFGDLDGDGLVDVITDAKLFVRTASGAGSGSGSGSSAGLGASSFTFTAFGGATPRAWTTAMTVDLDGDGRQDIVGFVDGQPDVDALLNAGGGAFNSFVVVTDAPVRFVQIGDFDGDFAPDLAIVTGDESGGSDENDELAISYGALGGGPGDPIVMGTFGATAAFASIGPIAQGSGGTPNALGNLVIAADRAGIRSGSLLLGDTSRQVNAPFVLPDPDRTAAPLTLQLGDFDGSGTDDLILVDSFGALAVGPTGTASPKSGSGDVLLLGGAGSGDVYAEATYTVGSAGDPLASFVTTSQGSGSNALEASLGTTWTHGVLTGAGPEALVAGRSNACDTEFAVGHASTAASSFEVTAMHDLLPADAKGRCPQLHALTVHDIDQDGNADALVQMCTGTCLRGTNVIVHGTGTGFDLASVVVLAPDLSCTRFAAVNTRFGQTILVSTCTTDTAAGANDPALSALVSFTRGADGTWTELARTAPVPSDGRLSFGDINGDGLEDVVVTSGQGADATVQVFLQCAVGDCGTEASP